MKLERVTRNGEGTGGEYSVFDDFVTREGYRNRGLEGNVDLPDEEDSSTFNRELIARREVIRKANS